MEPTEQYQASDLREALLASGLFDADWYAQQYPDVALTGLEPLEHFVSVGMLMERDPGPDFSVAFMRSVELDQRTHGKNVLRRRLENGRLEIAKHRVLLGAKALADLGRIEDAARLARQYLGRAVDRPLELFAANNGLERGDRQAWLSHLNDYLAPFQIRPLRLKPGKTLLDQLCADTVPRVTGGPLVSIIMSAFDAVTTIEPAIASILKQSWENLELLIVDDASNDGTWSVLQRIAATDSRVCLRRNPRNVGPYVSRNLALRDAKGAFITGHDADDWAHPQRIENHMARVLKADGAIKAGTNMMLRVKPSGKFDNMIPSSPHHSPDGIRRRAFVSCLFEREAMEQKLGYFDSVLFGGDGEMLHRAQKVFGSAYQDFDQFAMLCLDAPQSLTNHPKYGLTTPTGISKTRQQYQLAYQKWHSETGCEGLYLPFPVKRRPFAASSELRIAEADIQAVIGC